MMRRPGAIVFLVAILAIVATASFFIVRNRATNAALPFGIAPEWISIAVQGGGKMELSLRLDGTFTMHQSEDGKSTSKVQTLEGSYTLGSNPSVASAPDQKVLDLSLPISAAGAVGMNATARKARTDAGFTSVPFRRFLYDPTIPLLTDLVSVHLAPVGREQAVAQRLTQGANPLRTK